MASARCRWCGKSIKLVGKPQRLSSHKAIHDYEYRDDGRCPGTGVLRKHIPQHAITTQPKGTK